MEKINEKIREYQLTGHTWDSIPELLHFQGELATYSFYLAEQTAKAYSKYLMAEHTRKFAVADSSLNLSATFAMNKSTAMAEVSTKGLKETEIECERDYQTKKLQLNQINKILEHLTMKISCLKKEWENIGNQ